MQGDVTQQGYREALLLFADTIQTLVKKLESQKLKSVI